jgi:CBS domain-containing protein
MTKAKRRKGGAGGARRTRRTPSGGPARGRAVLARDLMTATPITVPEQMTVASLCDLLQEKNINGAPVVDARGRLVGVVTQEDIIYGAMGHPMQARRGSAVEERKGRAGKRVVAMLRDSRLHGVPPAEPLRGERPFWSDRHRPPDPMAMPVSSIMTSPAISADEETPLADLCRIMWNLRIHRLPILREGRVTGLVSSMDLCRAILDGTIRA